MQKTEAAMILAGVTPEEQRQASAPTNLHVITGTIAGKSENGKTRVLIDGLVFSADNSQYIEIDTLGGLQEGDTATILLTGEAGHGMTPLAVGAAGSIDRIDVRIGRIEADYVKATVLEANYATITNLDAATARIHELEVDHVTIDDFEAEQAKITNLQTATADIDTIRANSAKVQNLTAAQLEADHATIGRLDSTYATITNLNAANGRIDNLQSSKANVTDLTAATGRITSLEAADVNITGRLDATEAVIDNLDSNYIHTDMLNADVAWLQNGVIKDGSIVNGMIQSVSANKLTAGIIDASNITVTNLNASNITTGTINGQRIGTGSLSLDKLEEDVYTETEVNDIVAGLQTQIDGAIETWTGTDIPTLQNAPAVNWNTNAKKDSHVGDVYFVVNSNSQQNGYNYRFTKSGNAYSWQLIKDSDVTNALARLSTAEGKITTFDSDISTLKTDTGTLKTKTTSLETRMSDAEDDILDKVDTTTFNEVSDTVDSHSQTITQMSTTLSNKADGSTVTAVTQRVSKNEQDISGINTTIGSLQTTVASKADGSTVETISSNLNTISNTVDGHTQSLQSINSTLATKADSSTVSSLQQDYADFKQTTQQFESTVGTTYATKTELQTTDNKIENLEIGGKNLLRKTGHFVAADITKTRSTVLDDGTIRLTPTTSAAYSKVIVNYLDFAEYGSGIYTFSCEVKAADVETSYTSTKLNLHLGFNAVGRFSTSFNSSYDRYKGNTVLEETPTDWTKVSHTWVVPDDLTTGNAAALVAGSQLTVQVYQNGSMVPLDVRRLKLEKGNKATDWTPAPEDLESSVTSIEQRVTSAETSITQNTEAIGLKANAADVYTTTEVDGLITTEVSNRNAAISLSADAINQSVSSQYVTNQRFNDLKIGGRNLLPMTETWLASRVEGKTYVIQGITITQQDDGWFSVSGTRDSSVVDSSIGVISLWRNPSGDNHTESINARIPAPNSEKLYMSVEVEGTPFLPGTSSRYSSHVALYGDASEKNVRCGGYTELKKSLGIDSPYVSTIRYYIGINSSGTVNGRFRVKLETGDLATAWSPAPEDMATSESLSEVQTAIQQNAGDIQIVAKKSETVNGNMLYDVDTSSLTKVYGPANRYFSDAGNSSFMVCDIRAVTDSPATGIAYMAHWSVSDSTANKQRGFCFYSGNHIQFVAGQKYTLSCWVRCTSGKFLFLHNTYNGAFPASSGARTIDSAENSGWQFVTTTVTATRTQLDRVYFMARTLEDSPAFECDMCGFKMTVAAYATQAELKIANDAISSKVSTTDYNGNTIASMINQDATTVQIAASKVQIDGTAIFNSISSSVDSAITSKGYATTGEVATAKNEAITAAATDASAKADAVQSNLDNLEIGGRNLIRNGNFADGKNYWIQDGSTSVVETDSDRGTVLKVTPSSGNRRVYPSTTRNFTHETGETYSLSFYAKADASNTLVVNRGGGSDAYGPFALTTSWQKFESTVTTTGTGSLSFIMLADSTFYLSDVMLVHGNKPMDYVPAPEDQEAAINSARTWYAECPTVAATAAKIATITPATTEFKLETGVSVSVKFTYANSVASPTLNVNDTGAIAIMRYGTTAPSTSAATSWQANSINTLTYDGTYWRLNNWLNDNTTYNLGRNLHATKITVLEAVASGRLMVGTASGYKKIAAGITFTLGYPILYSSDDYSANTTYTNTYETWNSVTYSNTASIQSGAANKTIYLKGSISGNTFTIASSNVFTTVVPTSENGFLYIPLGVMSSATVGNFVTSSTLYAYIDGKFRQVTPTEIVSTHRIYYRTATADSTLAAPSTWVAEATGNVYDAWTTKVPPMAASTEEGQTKYLYLYTCEQRKRLDGTIECTKVLLDENTTVIDGGQIITNSVTANQIAAGTITAEEIAGGTITSDQIAAGAISADRLDANALTLGNIDGLEDRLAEIDAGLSTLSNSTQWVNFQENIGTVFGEEGSANNVTVKADGVYFNTEGGEAARASAGIFYSNEVQANDSISAPIVKIGNWALIQSGTTFSIEYLG